MNKIHMNPNVVNFPHDPQELQATYSPKNSFYNNEPACLVIGQESQEENLGDPELVP